MEVSIGKSGDITIAALSGQLDLETSPAVEEQLLAHVENETAPLLLDMSKLTYCSSRGLQVLIRLVKVQRAKEVGFGLFGLTDYLVELFDLAGMKEILNVYDSQQAALDGVGA